MGIPGSASTMLLGGSEAVAPLEIERSLLFGRQNPCYLTRTPASQGNTKKYTLSVWIKKLYLGTGEVNFFTAGTYNSTQYASFGFRYGTTHCLARSADGGTNITFTSWGKLLRDPAAWMHMVISVDSTNPVESDRFRLYINGELFNSSGMTLDRELGVNMLNPHRIGEGFQGYLADFWFVDNQALLASDFGYKDSATNQWLPTEYTGTATGQSWHLDFADPGDLGKDVSGNGNHWSRNVIKDAITPGAYNYTSMTQWWWDQYPTPRSYSSNLAYDGDPSTSAGVASDPQWVVGGTSTGARIKTTFSPAISYSSSLVIHTLNEGDNDRRSLYLNGVLQDGLEVNISGSGTLSSLEWGYKSGYWSSQYTLVKEVIVDGVPLVDSNIPAQPTIYGLSSVDSLVDTPTSYGTDTGAGGEVRGNYCTWNPIGSTGATLTNGNLDVQFSAGTANVGVGTIGVSSGKWYWEVVSSSSSVSELIGICDLAASSKSYTGTGGWAYWSFEGRKITNNTSTAYGASWTTGDVIGVALNMDVGEVTFYKNGVSQGVAYNTGLSGKTISPMVGEPSNSSTRNYTLNAGQRPFAYTAPSGFKALCDTNLPSPQVAKPSTVMDVKLYTGNATSLTVSGLEFSPDLVWIKQRSTLRSHNLYDTIRGALYVLQSDRTDQEVLYSNSLTSFNSDGFSVGNATDVNQPSGGTFAAWCWDAGSSTVTNTQGSITSTVRANASAGFSIVSWTSNAANAVETMGHGLGVSPELIIVKNRDTSTSDQWPVYHKAFTSANNYLMLNSTNAVATAAQSQWSTSSTTFGLRQAAWSSANTQKMIAYCFAPVAGYSSFGSYVGNGSASDGPFVYTGFRPRWVMVKKSSSTADWVIFDSSRIGYNANNYWLFPNTAGAEYSASFSDSDLLSNGFKPRSAGDEFNASGATYIYCAFAESPLQYARAR